MLRCYLKIFILGLLCATLGDIGHVVTNTTAYPPHFRHLFELIPWWVPPQFGLATLLIAFGQYTTFKFRWGFACAKFSPDATCLLTIPALTLCHALSGLVPLQPFLTIALIVLVSVATLKKLAIPTEITILSFITAIIASAVEIILIKLDVFIYTAPYQNLFGIPLWLPFLYLQAGITVTTILHYFVSSKNAG